MARVVGKVNKPAKEGDVGYDLIVDGDHKVRAHKRYKIPTKCRILGDEHWYFIVPRSSATDKGLEVKIGTIDRGFTGQLFVALRYVPDHDEPEYYDIKDGDRIAQVVFFQPITPPLYIIDEMPKTARGDSGFGSTNK
jgi:dUTP pyrophosphatase